MGISASSGGQTWYTSSHFVPLHQTPAAPKAPQALGPGDWRSLEGRSHAKLVHAVECGGFAQVTDRVLDVAGQGGCGVGLAATRGKQRQFLPMLNSAKSPGQAICSWDTNRSW